MSNDPLSFFAADSSDSSDSDEDKEPSEDAREPKEKKIVKDSNTKTLPPPMHALAAAKRPEFTIDPLRQDVDWDKLTKKAPALPEKEYRPWETKLPSYDNSVKTKAGKTQLTLAQQVPGGFVKPVSETTRSSEIVDRAMTWSKMYKNLDKDGKLKPVKPEEIGGEEGFLFTDLEAQKVAFGGIKRKSDSKDPGFRTKEARKRTMGQANREKMFVEDEKRVLRQQYDTNY